MTPYWVLLTPLGHNIPNLVCWGNEYLQSNLNWVLSWRKVNFASNGIHCIVFTLDPLLTECDQYLNLLKQLCRKFKFQLSGVYHNASRWEGCQSPALNLFSIPQIYPRKFVGPRLTVYICFKDNMSHLQKDIPTLMDSYKHFLPIIQCYGWNWNQNNFI